MCDSFLASEEILDYLIGVAEKKEKMASKFKFNEKKLELEFVIYSPEEFTFIFKLKEVKE
jgi:hypothetical protein